MKKPYIGFNGITTNGREKWLYESALDVELMPADKPSQGKRKFLLAMNALRMIDGIVSPETSKAMRPVLEERFKRTFDDKLPAYHVAQLHFDPARVTQDELYPVRSVRCLQELGTSTFNAIEFGGLPYDENPKKWGRFIRQVTQEGDQGAQTIVHVDPEVSEGDPNDVLRDLGELAEHLHKPMDYVVFDIQKNNRGIVTSHLLRLLDKAENDPALGGQTNFAISGSIGAKDIKKRLSGVIREHPDISWSTDILDGLRSGSHDHSAYFMTALNYLNASADVLETIDLFHWTTR